MQGAVLYLVHAHQVDVSTGIIVKGIDATI